MYDNTLGNNRENPYTNAFVNKSKAMAQNYMYLGCTPKYGK
ncbi:hypothetical protein bthur0004_56210 [Bacillus thuringiensis serovar sotto str. T04001]|nr:hypothetical protein bthur0004_56210 [Bacillus thuringiensis serovar sotto str. T04001]